MPTPAPVDTSSFTPNQSAAFSSAAKLGSGVPTFNSSNPTNYTATPPQSPVPKLPEQPAKPVTSFSSDTANQYNTDNTQKLQTLKNTGLTLGPDGLARYSDQSFASAPSDAVQGEDGSWQSGGVKYALGPANATDPALTEINDKITQMKTQFDATSRANIDNIQQQFNGVLKEQTDINSRAQSSLGQSLLMSGSSRYAQLSSSGEMTQLMSSGLKTLSDLNVKENSAVIAAQQAQDSGDMQLMDKQITLAEQARKDKQDAAKTLSDKITSKNEKMQAQKIQASRDSAVASLLAQGITDPNQMLDFLNKKDNGESSGGDFTAKEITDALANLNPNAKEIVSVMGDASKFGATPDVLKAIGSSKTLAEAYQAAGKYLQDPTSNANMYNSYVQRTSAAGQTPVSAEKFLDTQKANQAFSSAYATEKAKSAFSGSNQNQQKLEQEYRSALLKEISNKTGVIGTQSAKVDQANHLKALIDQYKDTNGDYQIPTSQYAELAIGLATLVSPGNVTSDADRAEIKSKTAAGDLAGAIQYATGQPQTGNTQGIIKNLIDSIDRQGQVAQQSRDQDVQFVQGLRPTDLNAERAAALEKNLLPSYGNISNDPLVKATQEESLASSAIKAYDAESPENAKRIDDLHTKFPQASAVEIKQALGI